MKWRRWNFILHRDIGYFCIGLTLIYAISGIAVNHLSHDFNPSYIIERTAGQVSPLNSEIPSQEYIDQVLTDLHIPEPFKNGAMLEPGKTRIFTETHTIDVDLASGSARIERVKKFPVLYEFNFLHLNKAKGIWTWIADLYGLALCLLAITGLLMMKKHNRYRSILFTFAGVLLPVGYLFLVM